MTKNLDSEGLKSIAENYDLFYIDLWGVMHNGIKLHEHAILALRKLLEINKDFVLLTNAPRPIQPGWIGLGAFVNKTKSLLISNNFLRVKIACSWSLMPLCITPHKSI